MTPRENRTVKVMDKSRRNAAAENSRGAARFFGFSARRRMPLWKFVSACSNSSLKRSSFQCPLEMKEMKRMISADIFVVASGFRDR